MNEQVYKARLLRSAILQTVETMFADPATMAAVECIAGDMTIDGVCSYLWSEPKAMEAFHLCSLGIEYSIRRRTALELVTGRSAQYWFGFPDTASADPMDAKEFNMA